MQGLENCFLSISLHTIPCSGMSTTHTHTHTHSQQIFCSSAWNQTVRQVCHMLYAVSICKVKLKTEQKLTRKYLATYLHPGCAPWGVHLPAVRNFCLSLELYTMGKRVTDSMVHLHTEMDIMTRRGNTPHTPQLWRLGIWRWEADGNVHKLARVNSPYCHCLKFQFCKAFQICKIETLQIKKTNQTKRTNYCKECEVTFYLSPMLSKTNEYLPSFPSLSMKNSTDLLNWENWSTLEYSTRSWLCKHCKGC